MALSHAQLQTAAYLALQVYQQPADWLVQVVDGTTFICLEGSDTAIDWRRNAEFIFTASDTHAGFENYATLLMAQMWAAGVPLPAGQPVVVTGHSLGGAVATIMAAQLQDQLPLLELVTFGSPRPGGRKLRKRLRVPHHRYRHASDIVPEMPLWVAGYRHTAPVIQLEPSSPLHALRGIADHDMGVYQRLIHEA